MVNPMGDRQAWHDRDGFWKLVEPFLFTTRRAELAQEQVAQIMALLGLETGARVLDLPCGNGRHALELAARGFEVTGIDRTESYIEEARREAARRGLAAAFQVGDMRDYRAPGQYDLVLNLFGSFGYFDDPADDMRVLENMAASLRPGGRLLIETAGKEIVARDFQPRDWFQQDDLLVLTERKTTHSWGRIETRYIVIKDGEWVEQTVSIRSFSAAELVSLLAAAGYHDVQVCGSLAGSAYDHSAERLVVIGQKG
jgi:SAM-dependent methyltransferase